MIDSRNRYEGFTTTENMTAGKVSDFLDRMSLRISRRIFVVLDNASVHRCRLMRGLRPVWEKRGLFLFFFLLIAHSLILPRLFGASSRGNGSDLWIISTQTPCSMLLNRALAAIGSGLKINFNHVA